MEMEEPRTTITLFLIDNDQDGWIGCEIPNRTILAYKIPRTKLKDDKKSEYTKRNGVYLLFGKREKDGKDFVYVGQADIRKDEAEDDKISKEGFLARLNEHINDEKIDYWTEAFVFTDSTNSFGSPELSYLENKF